MPGMASAANPVVTLGQDLSPAQRQDMLRYFGVRSRTMRLYIISNAQEHQLLDGVAPAREIGTRAISCVGMMDAGPPGQDSDPAVANRSPGVGRRRPGSAEQRVSRDTHWAG